MIAGIWRGEGRRLPIQERRHINNSRRRHNVNVMGGEGHVSRIDALHGAEVHERVYIYLIPATAIKNIIKIINIKSLL